MMRSIRVALYTSLTWGLFLWSMLALTLTSPALVYAQQHTITVGGDAFTYNEQAGGTYSSTIMDARQPNPYISASVSMTSRDGARQLFYRLTGANRASLEGKYTYVDQEISGYYVPYHGEAQLIIMDGEIRIALNDARIFPPEYDVYVDLYLLPADKASSWSEHRKFYTSSHPDDAIALSGQFTYRPQVSCFTEEELYHWVDDYGTGEVDMRTQFPQGVDPVCLGMAGVSPPDP